MLQTITNYTKLYNSSGLQLTLSAGVRSVDCCRYFFSINDTECSNPGPIEGISSTKSCIELDQPILSK